MSFTLKVDKSGWDKLKKEFEQFTQNEIRLGWFEEQKYGSDNGNLPMAQVAMDVEQGHVNGPTAMFPGAITPPRPFMRVGLLEAASKGTNDQQFATVIKTVISGATVFRAMEQVAPYFEPTLRKVMMDWDSPPNSAATVALKGFDNPLVKTGQLIANVKAKVSKTGVD